MYKIPLVLGIFIVGSIFSGYTIGASAQENAILETFVIEPNTYQEYILKLKTDCIVTASFTVDGGSNGILFHLTDPDGEIIFPGQTVTNGVDEFFFKAKKDGGYVFYFLSRELSGNSLIKLSYNKDCPKDEFGGGCLIATATYRSELAPQVQMLREIRDNSLLQTGVGTTFMSGFNNFYYSFSPVIADYERENPIFKEAVKLTITPLISSLSILNYVDMDSEAEVLGYGISLILLNVGMYFVAPAMVIHRIKKNLNS